MSSRRRRAAEPAPEEEQPEEERDNDGLKFNEPLSWRAGRPIPTTELHKRLDTLAKELAELDQDWEHKDSLTKVAKELCSANILGHKDKGVKAYAACCMVDILKICAPDAPFTPSQLKDIFALFINQILPALQDPSSTWNNQHRYVLISLSDVQSILLLDEIPNNDELFVRLFTGFFDTVSGTKAPTGELVGKDIEHYMTQILEMLIDEATTIPSKVIDIIMAQFLRAAAPGAVKDKTEQASRDENQTTLLLKEEPAAYKMARSVCVENPEKMARFVGQYFSDVIMEASGLAGSNGHRAADSDDEDGPAGPSEEDLKELRKAHLLIRELWKAAPASLQNVIPQLDAELSADNISLRQLATEALGDVIAGIGAAGPPPPPALDPAAYPLYRMSDFEMDDAPSNPLTTPFSPMSFAQTYHQAYLNFLSRKNDKSPIIRASWTTAVGYILSTNAGGIGFNREDERALVRGLGEKLNDSDEKVRLAGVKAIESFSFRDLILKLASDGGLEKENSILSSLADRCRDRRPQVRVDAMALLGKLWAISTGEILAANQVVVGALSAAPSKIYSSFYANDLEVNVLLDRVVFECLVPLSFPPPKKGSKSANGNSQSQSQQGAASYDQDAAFFAIQARQPQFATILQTFLKACDAYNGGVMEQDEERKTKNLKNTIDYIIRFLPDDAKVKSELLKFAKANNSRNYQLVKFITGPEHDFKTARNALKELVKRLQGAQLSGVADVLIPLLYRSGYFMFNRSHLSTILDYSRTDQDGFGATAHEILNEISQRTPDLFKSHIGDLCKDLAEKAPTATQPNEPSVVETLKACASYARKYPAEIPKDKNFVQMMVNFALYGTPWKAAKYAVNILLAKKDETGLLNATRLFKEVMKQWKYGAPHFLNKLAIVSQLEILTPKVTLDKDQVILEMIQDILKQVRTDAKDSDPDWVSDADMDEECIAKCLALKILVNRLRAEEQDRGDGEGSLKERAKPVFKMLKTLITKNGEMSKNKETPNHHKARLRLLAGQLVLKLCKEKQLDDHLPPEDFNALALVAQDAHPQTRRSFIEKLQKYLVQGKLRTRFYTIIFITAYEPVTEFKTRVETWIRSRVHHYETTGTPVMEAIMPRLLSLLAHHPDLGPAEDDLVDHSRYIVYYVSTVANESNLGLLARYAERVKQTKDAIEPEKSENLYMVCDLALAVVRKWQEKRGWTFEAYSKKTGLPTGLFLALPNHEAAQKLSEQQFIPDGIEQRLDKVLQSMDRKKKRKSMDDGGQPPAKKARSTSKPAQPRAIKSKKQTTIKKTPKARTSTKPKKLRATSPEIPESERRRSGRAVPRRSSNYVERDDDEDDEEMLEGVAEWDYGSGEEGEEGSDDEEAEEVEEEEEVEVEAEPMDEDEQAQEPAANENDGSELSEPSEEAEAEEEVEVEQEENEEEETPATNGRRSGRNSAPKAKPEPSKKPAPKGKAAAALPTRGRAAAATAKAPTRASGRSRRAKDVFDSE
ncbi:pds5 spo76 protein [Diaporthe amygdali]|uniref:pds5 spo76 protein n=1 Tax=Phomopsis amygdali TaxID=1214568 RepID=UPI0022FE7F4A|nr:pds5 spo76 protein [Diaporthe amygdali]KAJ0107717.1 pds5 spo76 protein [Diaporthe amygdali]